MKGICNLSIVPVRSEPSDRSEMVTQLLFGEHFTIIEIKNQWRKVINAFDEYEGWIDEKQFITLSGEDFERLENQPYTATLDLVQVVVQENFLTPVVLGSNLPFFNNQQCRLGEITYAYEGHVRTLEQVADKQMIVENAYMYLNSPYLWGGRSPFGIDCSGFTQMVYKLSGIPLKRDSGEQSEEGITLNFIEEATPGDLIYFDDEEGNIIHTGILLPDSKIIHASGKVRIDKIDHQGIFNLETHKYTHKLRLIKKFI